MLRRQTLILIILFSSATIFSQTIFDISLDIEQSLRNESYIVSVKFERRGDDYSFKLITKDLLPNKDPNAKLKFKTTTNKTSKITKDIFESLINAVTKISCSDIQKNVGNSGLDGSTCKISFGDWASSISYEVWSADSKTKERGLSEFLDACKLILSTAGLDPDKTL